MSGLRIPFHDLDEQLKRDGFDPCDPEFSFKDWLSETQFPNGLGYLAAYASVCWPDFVEFEDCIFLREHFTEMSYRGFLENAKGDKASVEAVINHEHILDMFGCACDPTADSSRELVTHVGQLLREMWQAKLNHEFPKRRFKVEFFGGNSEHLIDCQVTFYQER